MSVLETVLVFAGIPLLGVLVLTALIFGGSEMRAGRDRYRPGKPWTHEPVWYLPHAVAADSTGADAHPQIEGAAGRPAAQAVGGASGEW